MLRGGEPHPAVDRAAGIHGFVQLADDGCHRGRHSQVLQLLRAQGQARGLQADTTSTSTSTSTRKNKSKSKSTAAARREGHRITRSELAGRTWRVISKES